VLGIFFTVHMAMPEQRVFNVQLKVIFRCAEQCGHVLTMIFALNSGRDLYVVKKESALACSLV
jgi:hypothetical protein